MWFQRRRAKRMPEERPVVDVVRAFDVLLRVVEASERLSEALRSGDHASARSGARAIADAFSASPDHASLRQRPRQRAASERSSDRFVVDVPMLRDAARHLAARGKEGHGGEWKEAFVYVAGMPVGERTYVLGRMLPVDYAEQSAGGVRVADRSNIRVLEAVDRAGLMLVAHVHSHPGRGPEATRPSATDRSFQKRLERGGHVAVGLIFDRGGPGGQFVRFFAGEGRDFAVDVCGNGAKEIDRHVYQVRAQNGAVPLADD